MILFDPGGLQPPISDASRFTRRSLPARQQFETSEQFSQAIQPHLLRLVTLARGILRSEDLAWDVVMETLQRIWVQGSLPEDSDAVLRHLVLRACQHQRRCTSRREHHEFTYASAGELCCEDDPLADVESSEQVLLVREAVRGIAEKYRVVLQRIDLEGESYQTTADELGLPIGTIRSRLSRGRDLLRQRLTPGESELST